MEGGSPLKASLVDQTSQSGDLSMFQMEVPYAWVWFPALEGGGLVVEDGNQQLLALPVSNVPKTASQRSSCRLRIRAD
ncbi:hypothetical protein QC764_200502 [Podospora pseudoanserina]|uniref:Uncharacterized protein n=1 Tax=Podospora pseudoanserina TaxID=2609844 RepID=A0ABR0IF42_9PEZI|nr:hypothetical protein QC764_200502 [Podospora pseudoanserina]